MANKVLIVDDDPDLLKTLCVRLQSAGYDVVCSESGSEVIELARRVEPGVIILDVIMPVINGFEVKKRLNLDPMTSGIPVIFLSADTYTDEKIKGLGLGADDYITKPFVAEELIARIRTVLDRKLCYEKMAMIDGLTGLYNQAFFKKQLRHLFSVSTRYKKTFSVAVIDVDDLKKINDSYGHAAGDRILKEFSRMARQVFRESDILARYGGDEFAILMPETDLRMARTAVERLREKIRASPTPVAGDKTIVFEISAGIVAYDDSCDNDIELFKHADRILYDEKARKQHPGSFAKEEVLMHKKKILVIDDETDFLRLLEMRLEANGYEVITASDGKEGLDKLRSAKPDAVILDIMMPKMDGLNVLKAVRKHDKNLPVFIVTAYNDPDKIAASQDLDASGFIVKTADLGEEIRRITSALNIADRYRSL